MKTDFNTKSFIELVSAGLWERAAWLTHDAPIDIEQITRLAFEQTVVGLVAAGLEHTNGYSLPKERTLSLVGNSLQIEQRNMAMNSFLEGFIRKLHNNQIEAILIKGQGLALCYERPLWRSSGDIDLLMDKEDYQKAKTLLMSSYQVAEEEDVDRMHIGFYVDGWVVELHGTLRTNCFKSLDKTIDDIQRDTFQQKRVRYWKNGDSNIKLPEANDDVLFVFSHILQHFYKSGIGLRQICDWCRLLWTFNDSINRELLFTRLKNAGIVSEWKAFAYLAVNFLGMPEKSMPFYESSRTWSEKAERILTMMLKSGNFGHNRDIGYKFKYHLIISYLISFFRYTKDSLKHFCIFPGNSIKVWNNIVLKGIRQLSNI